MSGSTYGKIFKIMTWGESHGPGIGVVIDGCPSGLQLCESDIQTFLNRRKPGQSKFTTARNEADQVEILSGVFEGVTTGTPISLMIRNQDQHSKDYGNLADTYRPGHADYTFDKKYGFRDYRGGGRSSGRETAGRVAAGAIATKILNTIGISICTYTKAIGPIEIDSKDYHFEDIIENKLYMPNNSAATKATNYLSQLIKNQDSSGGTIECLVKNMPVGIGETVFDKLDANLAKAIMSIGAVKAIEIGDGTEVSSSTGSLNNDSFVIADGKIQKATNHSGGILGGMSDGSTISLRAHIKPTPSIAREQQTVTKDEQPVALSIHGRHDPIIVPRAVVVVESMVALTLVDLLFQNMNSKLDSIIKFYQ